MSDNLDTNLNGQARVKTYYGELHYLYIWCLSDKYMISLQNSLEQYMISLQNSLANSIYGYNITSDLDVKIHANLHVTIWEVVVVI